MAYFVDGLATELRKYGLTVVEVDGSKTRGYAGRGMSKVASTMWHHTATARSAFLRSPAPTLAMCTYGRAGLAGPLTQMLLARNGVVYVIATGWSNHAGTGKWTNIDWHRGNDQSLGVEVESSGIAPWDLTPEQLHTAPILGAALRLIFGHANDPSHAEYSDAGKIDIAGWPGGWDGLRKQISDVRFGGLQSGTFTPIQEDDMPSADEVAGAVWGYKNKAVESGDAYAILRVSRDAAQTAARETAKSDAQISNLVQAIGSLAKGEPFDEAKLLAGVKAAAAEGVKNAVDSIETTVNIK